MYIRDRNKESAIFLGDLITIRLNITGAGSFLAFGYAFAFGSGSQFIGYTHFGLIGLELDDYAFMFFQVKHIYIYLSIFFFFFIFPVYIRCNQCHHRIRCHSGEVQLQWLHHLLCPDDGGGLPHPHPLGLGRRLASSNVVLSF